MPAPHIFIFFNVIGMLCASIILANQTNSLSARAFGLFLLIVNSVFFGTNLLTLIQG